MMKTSRCTGCGAEIFFIKSDSGATIPLNATRAPAYEIRRDLTQEMIAHPAAESVYISHFSTCPKRNDFSSSRRP